MQPAGATLTSPQPFTQHPGIKINKPSFTWPLCTAGIAGLTKLHEVGDFLPAPAATFQLQIKHCDPNWSPGGPLAGPVLLGQRAVVQGQ